MVAAVKSSLWRQIWMSLLAWFDSDAVKLLAENKGKHIDWLRTVPFIAMHLACFAVIWVGWSTIAVGTAIALYLVRMFAITGFYHRYFSHRSFKTSRVLQFIFAMIGASLVQRWGRRRYDTADNSRNNFWLALLTLGEGWHNNHHHYPASVKQGFYWWEIDMTYYLLRLMAALGLVWDLKPVPVKHRESNRLKLSPSRSRLVK